MTTRTSTRTQQVEVITRGERRRRWSIEKKREIIAESLQPDRPERDHSQAWHQLWPALYLAPAAGAPSWRRAGRVVGEFCGGVAVRAGRNC
jgi:hypothetical protein